jgi:RNA polymerase sigma-70 factor (ECF subfamily)
VAPIAEQTDGLLRQIAVGDRAAFGRLYDATSPAIFGLLVKMLRSPEAAEEVAQEVYLEVWKKATSFDPDRGTGSTWISLIARSRALDRIRSERSYSGAVDRAEESVVVADLFGGNHSDPEEAASLSERRRLVRGAMREIPEEQRTVVLLSFFRGLSHSEIADRQGIPLGTVKSRIRAGLEKVAGCLQETMGGGG